MFTDKAGLLLAQSGHSNALNRCLLLGVKRTVGGDRLVRQQGRFDAAPDPEFSAVRLDLFAMSNGADLFFVRFVWHRNGTDIRQSSPTVHGFSRQSIAVWQ